LGPRERREREREEIRGRILDAARELFANEGYEAVTMRRIAEKIEYSPTAIYFHFKDKESLLNEICDADFLTLAQQFGETARLTDPLEKLKATGLAYVRFGLTHPNHYRLMFMTPHPPMDPAAHTIQKGKPEEDAYAFLKSIITEGIEQGVMIDEDVDLLAQTMWGGVHGVISLQIAKCNDDWIDWRSLDERAQLMVDLLVAGIARKES
jgi:AcrR family transcriptional regulator